jgi:hypothetical protein
MAMVWVGDETRYRTITSYLGPCRGGRERGEQGGKVVVMGSVVALLATISDND